MAKKKLLNPLEDPPTASSSHEEEEEEEVETSSGEDEEQISDSSSKENKSKDSSNKTLKTTNQSSHSDSGSDSGEDEEQISDSSSKENKSKDSSNKTLKTTNQSSHSDSGSDSDSDTETEPSPKPAAVKSKKRASEGTSTSTDVNAKRAKKNLSGGEDNKKNAYFQRLWSEEDEITLLQGMIDYKADNGKSPYVDMNGFFELLKKAISFDVSKAQFVDKIRWLKKKYFGKPRKVSFTEAHDKKCLELAKYIWGSDGLALESAVKSKKKVEQVLGSDGLVGTESPKSRKSKRLQSKVVDEDTEMFGSEDMVARESAKCKRVKSESSNWFDKSFLVRTITGFGVDEQSVKQRWRKLPMKTKKRLEDKLKLLQSKEFGLLRERTGILNEVTTLISQAI